ncbi:hypothetical protein ACJX0J_006556 [Zea mays]
MGNGLHQLIYEFYYIGYTYVSLTAKNVADFIGNIGKNYVTKITIRYLRKSARSSASLMNIHASTITALADTVESLVSMYHNRTAQIYELELNYDSCRDFDADATVLSMLICVLSFGAALKNDKKNNVYVLYSLWMIRGDVIYLCIKDGWIDENDYAKVYRKTQVIETTVVSLA